MELASKANTEAKLSRRFNMTRILHLQFEGGELDTYRYLVSRPDPYTSYVSRLWHGPYRIISRDDPDITATKIFFPGDPSIQVQQSRVCKCLPSFPNKNLVVLQNNFLESLML